jgi:hypothetical protein
MQASPGRLIAYDVRGPLDEPSARLSAVRDLVRLPLPVVFMAAEDRSPIDTDASRFAATTAAALVASASAW